MLEWTTRNASIILSTEWRTIASAASIDPVAIKASLLEAVAEARETMRTLPAGPAGALFLAPDGTIVPPPPGLLQLGADARARGQDGVTALTATVGGAGAQVSARPDIDPA